MNTWISTQYQLTEPIDYVQFVDLMRRQSKGLTLSLSCFRKNCAERELPTSFRPSMAQKANITHVLIR